jgi:hypothetical protein
MVFFGSRAINSSASGERLMSPVSKTDPKLVTAITWNKGKEIKEETRKSYSDEEKHKHQCLYGKEHPEHN